MAPFIERDMTILIDVTDRRPSEGLFIKVHRGSALISQRFSNQRWLHAHDVARNAHCY